MTNEIDEMDDLSISEPLLTTVTITDVVMVVKRSFLVFPDVPTCVARMPKGNACGKNLVDAIWSKDSIQFATELGVVDAFLVYEDHADCAFRQRCPGHVKFRGPDATKPEWCEFDAIKHRHLIHHFDWAWTEDGLICMPRMTIERRHREPQQEQVPTTPPPPRPSNRTTLYRYFDADDVLLYIGIARSAPRRAADHDARSSWSDFAVRSTMQKFGTRKEAAAAEADAIKAELPLFNSQHVDLKVTTPRLVEYLVKHGRADLLVPNVSRG